MRRYHARDISTFPDLSKPKHPQGGEEQRIRTSDAVRHSGLANRCIQPLCQPLRCERMINRRRTLFDFALPPELHPEDPGKATPQMIGIEPMTQILFEGTVLHNAVHKYKILQSGVNVNTVLVYFY